MYLYILFDIFVIFVFMLLLIGFQYIKKLKNPKFV